MEYNSTVVLKDGRACTLRNGTASDGQRGDQIQREKLWSEEAVEHRS